MKTIDETIEYIKEAHRGQKQFDGSDYYHHPIAVMKLLPDSATHDERLAALLHDVLEDTDITEDELRDEGFSERTIYLVKMLTREEGTFRPTYINWIRSIAEIGDVGLMQIKLSDNLHNMDPDRIAALPQHMKSIEKRYKRSAKILTEAIENAKNQSS